MFPKTLIRIEMIRAMIVGTAIFLIKYFGAVSLYFKYCVMAVNNPRMIAMKISMRLYAKVLSSPTDQFVPKTLLITGSDVAMRINIEERNKTNEPMNIQNSLE